MLEGHNFSRRDDVIQAIYVVIYLLNKFKDITKQSDRVGIRKFKLSANSTEICKGEMSYRIAPILDLANSIEFDEEPNYGRIKFEFAKLLMKIRISPADHYSW